MGRVILEVDDSQLDRTLEVLNALKDVMIVDIKLKDENINEEKDFIKLSNSSFEKIWDNKEDSIYDKFLK